jgi:type II secretory pathway pseudopilin PulG
MRKDHLSKTEKGQAWIIMAVAITALIILLGFAIDSAVLFSNYTKLKRAVDAAAVAAANQYKVKTGKLTPTSDFDKTLLITKMTQVAQEMLIMHDLDTSAITLVLRICGDPDLQANYRDFYNKCPESQTPPGSLRKLVYIQASEEAPTYFLHIIGINSIPITTNSVSEAAPIDLVLVFDTSESMGVNTVDPATFVTGDFNPADCNTRNTCLPLRTAKDDAKQLVDTLYDGYDQVAIVTFDQVAVTRLQLSSNLGKTNPINNVRNAIDAIPLHDDAPGKKLFPTWWNHGQPGLYNPVNPEDRDNNGDDADPGLPACTPSTVDKDGNPLPLGKWLDWDFHPALGTSFLAATGLVGVPCDFDNKTDAFDWNGDGMIDDTDVAASDAWISSHECVTCTIPKLPMSILSTCTGCGIRVATANLVGGGGRSNAVWVMVVLTDGVANLTDTPLTFPYNGGVGIPDAYKNGFCGGSLGNNPLWSPKFCVKTDVQRYCINPTPMSAPTPVAPGGNCPPGSGYISSIPVSPPYSPDDYARDMVDRAALLHSTNPNEALGSDMAIYTIGLGDAAVTGAPLLRYMALVGTNGDRAVDPCAAYTLLPKQSCGQYYFAQNDQELGPIFDSIASRIYTKITY